MYEWCMTEKWDASNPVHKKIAHDIELGDGIPEMRSIDRCRQAIKTVGYEIVHEEDLADRGEWVTKPYSYLYPSRDWWEKFAIHSEVPWYYSLTGDLRMAQTWWDLATLYVTSLFSHLIWPGLTSLWGLRSYSWRMTGWGRGLTGKGVWLFEKFGIVPKGTWDVQETLKIAADALVVCFFTSTARPLAQVTDSSVFEIPTLFRLELNKTFSLLWCSLYARSPRTRTTKKNIFYSQPSPLISLNLRHSSSLHLSFLRFQVCSHFGFQHLSSLSYTISDCRISRSFVFLPSLLGFIAPFEK